MAEWREAFRLAAIELKVSKLGTLIALLWTLFIWNGLNQVLVENIRDHIIMADMNFILFFLLVGYFARGGFYQKTINDRLMASHQLILLKTLPATRTLITKRHIALFFIRSITFQMIFCFLLYWTIPEVRAWLVPLSYTAFSCMWIAFGLVTGGVFVAFDIILRVDRLIHYLAIGLLLAFCFMPALSISLALVNYFTNHTLLYWTITAAAQAPILVLIISICTIVASLYFWMKMLIRNIQDRDLY